MKRRRRLEVCISDHNDTSLRWPVWILLVPLLLGMVQVKQWPVAFSDQIGTLVTGISMVTDLDKAGHTLAVLVLGGILVVAGSRSKRYHETIAVLTVYPGLGAQLSTETRSKRSSRQLHEENPRSTAAQIRYRLFLPMDVIVDCLVYEVVLSHKVMSAVALRIQPVEDKRNDTGAEQDLQLIPVFPETEMTYEECLYMRKEIIRSLELPD